MANLTGGNANDTLLGGAGADTLDGGAGDDFIAGKAGDDLLIGGKGDDTFRWDLADGSDTVNGGAGFDTLVFNTSSIGEVFSLTARADGHAILTRNIANITMDLDNVERVAFGPGAGADIFNLGDLSGTDVTQVDIDLGPVPDGSVDTIAVNGQSGNDSIVLTTANGATAVSGLATALNITGAESIDRLAVHAGAGDDTLDVSAFVGGIGVNFDGGEGSDTLVLTGSGGADEITLASNPAAPGGEQLGLFVNGLTADGAILDVETVRIDGGAGDDRIVAVNFTPGAEALFLDGGDGADRINGSHGAEIIDGGAGDDFIDGEAGDDLLNGGKGDDTIQWDPGDGNDTVNGGAGFDTLVFNTSSIGEVFSLTARADGHAILTRNIANVSMDLVDVERVAFGPGGGADIFNLGDLSATDVTQVDIDLGLVPDNAVDTIVVGGQSGNDSIVLTTAKGATAVSGLATALNITGAEADDRLAVNAGAGDDTLDVSAFVGGIGVNFDGGLGVDTLALTGSGGADEITLGSSPAAPGGEQLGFFVNGLTADGAILNVETVRIDGGDGDDVIVAANFTPGAETLFLDGGDGADRIFGSHGAEIIDGGAGDDFIDGEAGDDLLNGGGGDDTIQWDLGDGNDTVNGGAGFDTLTFNDANLSEVFNLTASADGHVILTRNIAGITMDLVDVERVAFGGPGGGGGDTFNLGDLSTTNVKQVDIDLGLLPDNAVDTIVLAGQSSDNDVVLTANGDSVSINGLAAAVNIAHATDIDRLFINLGDGRNTFDASTLGGQIGLTVVGGADNDREVGSRGVDALSGGGGDDVLAGGDGDDVLSGGAGSDRFEFVAGSTGRDLIVDFQAHGESSQGDLIVLNGFSDGSFAEALADGHIVQAGTDVIVGDAFGSIVTLRDVQLSSLHANDFLFG